MLKVKGFSETMLKVKIQNWWANDRFINFEVITIIMEKNLEHRINSFREKIMGKHFSEKYPLEFSEDGTIIKKEFSSGSDCIEYISKLFGKLMLPYFGDKNAIEWVKLESEINPKNKVERYIATGIFIAGKYTLLYTLLNKIF